MSRQAQPPERNLVGQPVRGDIIRQIAADKKLVRIVEEQRERGERALTHAYRVNMKKPEDAPVEEVPDDSELAELLGYKAYDREVGESGRKLVKALSKALDQYSELVGRTELKAWRKKEKTAYLETDAKGQLSVEEAEQWGLYVQSVLRGQAFRSRFTTQRLFRVFSQLRGQVLVSLNASRDRRRQLDLACVELKEIKAKLGIMLKEEEADTFE